MGQGYLILGRFREAQKQYSYARVEMPKDKLVECGNVALEDGNWREALEAFEAAEEKMPEAGLITCGKKAMELGQFKDAIAAFDAAGHTEGLIASGERALEQGRYNEARQAFEAAGVELNDTDKLLACAMTALTAGLARDAYDAFYAAVCIEEGGPDD
jgi:tetratricopeptide (TPR) repeat protein